MAERQAAERAYRRGDYPAAAEHWAKARALAPNRRESDEALYRLAATHERAGETTRASALYAELERGGGERAARAAYTRAALARARDPNGAGARSLRSALLRFPDAGPARAALLRWLADVEARAGARAALAEIESLRRTLDPSELGEVLLFERARRSEALVAPARARELYLAVAARFPYPFGAYWDDALLAAARLDVALGEFQAAVDHLSRILSERETARLSGSYERKSFAEARFRIAEIYRDRLHEPERARAEFRRVFTDHATSLLRDDALFEESLILLRQGRAACEPAGLLVRTQPGSRFAACAALLCPMLGRPLGACRSSVERRIRDARRPEDYSSSSSSR
jgi:tetratricopeptide (TPR) repeat protein